MRDKAEANSARTFLFGKKCFFFCRFPLIGETLDNESASDVTDPAQ